MKTILYMLVAGVGVYYGYNFFQNPAKIQNPTYGA